MKTTEKFCDRVRKEVVEKLDNMSKREDKFCQTICNAGVQTEGSAESLTLTTENVRETAPLSHLPPDIGAEVSFHNHEAKKEFLNVIEIGETNEVDPQVTEFTEINFPLESIDEFLARSPTDKSSSKIVETKKLSGDDKSIFNCFIF